MQKALHIQQFYDKGLSHSSYAILADKQVILIDPARDVTPYKSFAEENDARIVAVIETHPHADFVSSHLELAQNGATVYASKLTNAEYPHLTFDDGDEIRLGDAVLRAMNTPGHSPDSICITLEENGVLTTIFTGDTLFAGDVGRPDLREQTPGAAAKKEELARAMYRSTREKLMTLPQDTKVYPAHGPGSLCGKHLSPDLWTTIGTELRNNYALQPMDADAFVNLITSEQPFIPLYFGYDVGLNKKGAAPLDESLGDVAVVDLSDVDPATIIVDTRSAADFRAGHAANSINIPDGNAFETWLGAVIAPTERFYLLAATADDVRRMLRRAATIGYESLAAGTIAHPKPGPLTTATPDVDDLHAHPEAYTIVDVRNTGEIRSGKIFESALPIPLPELRNRVNEIPADRPILVHCAGGYRSAIGSSIVTKALPGATVYDLGPAIEGFKK